MAEYSVFFGGGKMIAYSPIAHWPLPIHHIIWNAKKTYPKIAAS